MNHYDIYISEFLSRNKSVSFEKIGHLSYFSNATSAGEPVATGALQFTYDKKASTTRELIDYIAERTAKNKTLIGSDIESYFGLMRQIVNIGNPHEIDGVGVFKLAKSGQIEFSVPDLTVKKDEQKSYRKQQSLSGTSFQPVRRRSKTALMFFAFLIILGVLGVIGWGAYQLFLGTQNSASTTDTVEQITSLPQKDTVATLKDTTALLQQPAPLNPNDSAPFKFIHEITASYLRAEKRTAQLIGFGNPSVFDSLDTDTGKVYRLYLKLKVLPADTTRVRDSLQKYFQRNISIDRDN